MLTSLRNKTYTALRRSESFFKTDMVYLAKGGFWLTAGQVVTSISTFLLAIAFANLLLPETYGTYKYILSIAGILAIPTLGGLNTALVQAVSRGYEGSFIPSLKTKIRWGLLGGIASLSLAGYYFLNDNTELTISFLLISVFLPFMDSFSLYTSFLQGKKLFRLSASFNAASSIIATCVMIGTLFFTNNLFLVLITYFASWTMLHFIFLKITLKKLHPNPDHDPKTISYGKHLSLIGITGVVAGQLDKIIIFHFLGAAGVAVYFIAIAPVEQIKGFIKIVPALALPNLSQRSFEEVSSVLHKRLFKLFLIGGVIAGIYILIAPLFFQVFFPKYPESIPLSQLFSIILMLTLPLTFFATAFYSKISMTKKTVQTGIAGNILQILLLIIMGFYFGIIGVILARIMAYIFAMILDLILWNT